MPARENPSVPHITHNFPRISSDLSIYHPHRTTLLPLRSALVHTRASQSIMSPPRVRILSPPKPHARSTDDLRRKIRELRAACEDAGAHRTKAVAALERARATERRCKQDVDTWTRRCNDWSRQRAELEEEYDARMGEKRLVRGR